MKQYLLIELSEIDVRIKNYQKEYDFHDSKNIFENPDSVAFLNKITTLEEIKQKGEIVEIEDWDILMEEQHYLKKQGYKLLKTTKQ